MENNRDYEAQCQGYDSQREEMMLDDESDLKKPVDKNVQKRPSWTRGIDFLIACLGGSIGLGNVWRFPYLCYKNGGGAFLIPYFLCILFGSLPLLILEAGIGQYMAVGSHRAWGILPLFQGVGMSTVMIVFYICCYYNVVLAWSFMYMFHSFTSQLPWDSCDGIWNTDQCSTDFTTESNNTTAANHSMDSNNTSPLVDPATEFWEKKVLALSSGVHDIGTPKWDLALCLVLAWVVVYLCICKGIKSSGKVMYFTAPAPYVFMLVILIRNATLEGAGEGVSYYLRPNMTKLYEYQVWADAAKQTFFSSSICQSVWITLGSYNKFKHNFCRDSILFSIVNAFTSFFAGFLVFTILGFMAFQQGRPIDEVAESGPGLVFIAYPKALTQMPLPQFWSVVFFLMCILLGLDSEFIGVEAVMTCCLDQFPDLLRRKYRKEIFIAGICIVMFLLGLVNVCNGGMYVFQMFDFYCVGKTIVLCGLLEVVGMTYVYGFRRFYDNMVMMVGSKWMEWMKPYLIVCWMFFTPLVCFLIFMLSIVDVEELTYSRPNKSVYHYPGWAHAIGWVLSASTVVWIPGIVLYRFIQYGFSVQVLRLMLVPFKLKPHQMRPQDKLERCLADFEQETIA